MTDYALGELMSGETSLKLSTYQIRGYNSANETIPTSFFVVVIVVIVFY